MSPSSKSFYQNNGYVVFKKVYKKSKCDEIKKIILTICDNKFSQMLNVHREDFLLAQNLNKINSIKNLAQKTDKINNLKKISKYFLSITRDLKFVKKLNHLYDREVVGLQSQIIIKKPGSLFGKQSYNPHQDNSYAKNKKGLFFTTHLFLEKATKRNGTLFVYPKTHKLGLLKFNSNKSFDNLKNAGNKIDIKEMEKKYKKTYINAEPGDFVVLHGHCVHGSSVNTSKTLSRMVYTTCCIPKGEKFLSGKNARREVFSLKK